MSIIHVYVYVHVYSCVGYCIVFLWGIPNQLSLVLNYNSHTHCIIVVLAGSLFDATRDKKKISTREMKLRNER